MGIVMGDRPMKTRLFRSGRFSDNRVGSLDSQNRLGIGRMFVVIDGMPFWIIR